MNDNQVEVIKELEEKDGEVVYKDAFIIDVNDLASIIEEDMPYFNDVDDFLENYDYETDGNDAYNYAKDKNFNIKDVVENSYADEEEDNFETDTNGFDDIEEEFEDSNYDSESDDVDLESLDDLEDEENDESDDRFDDFDDFDDFSDKASNNKDDDYSDDDDDIFA